MADVICKHFLISGRVQGVGFRNYTLKKAIQCQVTGWVRNLFDGRVEALAQGPSENVNQIEIYIRRGPMSSEVHQVNAQSCERDPHLEIFEIKLDGEGPCM